MSSLNHKPIDTPVGLETDSDGMSRRRWLQLMGASLALAGVGGCWKRQAIRPLVERPIDRVPGEPDYYCTAMDLNGSAVPLKVTAVDGRPIKIEGNSEHPQGQHAAGIWAQASILSLYDPDRMPKVSTSWQESIRTIRDALAKNDAAGFHIFSQSTSSPTQIALRAELLAKHPNVQWHEYEPLSRDNERHGTQQAFGQPFRVHFDLSQADVLVCLDVDLLGSHPASVAYAQAFAERRDPSNGPMNRLYAIESTYTITGGAADHRLPLRSSQIGPFVAELEQAVVSNEQPAGDNRIANLLSILANDLKDAKGKSLVAVGAAQPPSVHAAVCRINAALENMGKTVQYLDNVDDPKRPSHIESIRTLVAEMHAGRVETLLILGGNPIYNAPADLDFAAALKKVPTSIHLGLYRDETALASSMHVPEAHFLESWGDARSFDGTYSVMQPLIRPLFDGHTSIELLAAALGDDSPDARDRVRDTFRELTGEALFERRWNETLDAGFLAESAYESSTPKLSAQQEPADVGRAEEWAEGEPLEIVFSADRSVYDGRFANNGWLQELPDPITRLTWDNAALIAPATADKLGIENATLVTLSLGEIELEMPAYKLPGQAAGSVSVMLGYGRTAAGNVGGNTSGGVSPVGVNTYQLRRSDTPSFDLDLKLTPTGKPHPLASTQAHHQIDPLGMKTREQRSGTLIREATQTHYQQHPDFAQHAVHLPPLESLWSERTYEGHRWGMTIDLSKCIGCGACVVGCQAENNVPVVGKERILQGREMHWIRVDRYFTDEPGEPDNPSIGYQPLACHHCEMAPCEQVCPVAATVHTREGLNDMVYNRCVGTRYCANNCPYKVRRFNYFNYHKDLKDSKNELAKMLFNPEVTVRSRGVMEKCTYCVQRIQAAKIRAKREERSDIGPIETACQQACPTRAIEFGDLNASKSPVSIASTSDRAYAILAELNNKPRTVYLAKIRNPVEENRTPHS